MDKPIGHDFTGQFLVHLISHINEDGLPHALSFLRCTVFVMVWGFVLFCFPNPLLVDVKLMSVFLLPQSTRYFNEFCYFQEQ